MVGSLALWNEYEVDTILFIEESDEHNPHLLF
jgi:hypothetical protein